MVFYGLKPYQIKTKPYSLFWSKKKIKFFKKYGHHIRRVNLSSFYNLNLSYRFFALKIPFNWDIVILSNIHSNKLLLYLFSDIYFFRLPFLPYRQKVYVDPNSSTVLIKTIFVNNYCRLYWNLLNQVFTVFHKPFFLKVKFKGKGYYIFKNKRSTITPQFGHSHRLYLYSYFVSVTFLAKTRIILFGFRKSDLINVGLGVKKMRPINIFTGRGVRFNRQIVYKKTGKVSSYR